MYKIDPMLEDVTWRDLRPVENAQKVAAGLWRVLNYFNYLACVGETLNNRSHDAHFLQEQWPSGMT